jgi:soluble lytic murein transglycosylase
MPETALWIADQLGLADFDADRVSEPVLNLRLGTWYLRYLLDRFEDRDEALAAYNAGPSRAAEWKDPQQMPAETATYVGRVSRNLPIYRFYFAIPWLLSIIPSVLL